jgi:hypothetical protein
VVDIGIALKLPFLLALLSISLLHHLIFNDAFGLYWVLNGFNSDISLPWERQFEGVKVMKIDIPMGSKGNESEGRDWKI